MISRRLMQSWYLITLFATVIVVLSLAISITLQFESVFDGFRTTVDEVGLDQVETSVRIMDVTARDIALKVHNHPATILLSLSPDIDKVSPSFVRSFLRMQDMALPFIHSVNVIHVPSGNIISTSQGWSQVDNNIIDSIELNYPGLPTLTPLPLTSVISRTGKPETVFFYLVREKYADETGLTRGVILMVEASWFIDAVSQANDRRTGTHFFLYHPHTGILGSDSERIDYAALSDSLRNRGREEKDEYSIDISGTEHSIKYRQLENTDLLLVRLRDESIIQKEINSLRLKITLISVFLLSMVLLGGIVVNRRVYKPYYSAIADIRDSFSSRLDLPDSDQAMLNILYSNLRDEYSDSGNDRVTAECIRTLCQEGVGGSRSTAEVLRNRGIRLSPRFSGRIVHLAIDDIDPDFTQLQPMTDADYGSLKFRTRKAVEDALKDKDVGYHLFYRNQGVAVIVLYGKEGTENSVEEDTGRYLSHLVRDYLQHSVSIVVSKPIQGYAQLQTAYQSGASLLAHRFLEGRGMTIFNGTVRNPIPEDKRSEIVPLRNRILESLAERITNQSDLDAYFSILQSWDVPSVQYELNFFSLEVIRTLMQLDPNANYQELFKELINQPTLDDFRSVIEDSLKNDSDAVYTADARHAKLVDAVRKIVESRYPEPGLGIHIVSDEISMNAAYFGMVFKRIVGSSFADYLTTVRIQESARLLTQSRMSVQEIMNAVGIPSESTFFRRFRERYHLTPQRFRRESSLRSHSSRKL